MNILLINHYAGSMRHGMEYRPFYLGREWVNAGHTVVILAASFSHVRTLMPSVQSSFTEQYIDGIRYIWLKTPSYKNNDFRRASNIFAFIGQLFRFLNKFCREIQPDVVIASSTYTLDIFPGHLLSQKANAKLIYEVRDLWPLSPIVLGGMSPFHPFIMLLQLAENYAYRYADKVVSSLPKAGSYLSKHGMTAEKLCYIPNGIVADEWENNISPIPEEHRKVILGLKQAGHFVVGYAGGHNPSNALRNLIDSAAILRRWPVSFVLVGKGSEKDALLKTKIEKGHNNVRFLPPVPKRSIPSMLAMLDALYIGAKKVLLYRFGVSPNKLLEYMMAAKPVIHAIEASNDLVMESGCGLSIPSENPQALAEAVIKLMEMAPSEREEMGLKGRKYALAHHDYKILAKQYLSIFDTIQLP